MNTYTFSIALIGTLILLFIRMSFKVTKTTINLDNIVRATLKKGQAIIVIEKIDKKGVTYTNSITKTDELFKGLDFLNVVHFTMAYGDFSKPIELVDSKGVKMRVNTKEFFKNLTIIIMENARKKGVEKK